MKPKILFGTAGIPISTEKPSAISGIERVKSLGLQAMELEFVHGVNIKQETAEKVRKTAEKENISLSVHGPYYINLNSKEITKQKASIQRIFDSARIGGMCGAKTITFHAGFFQGMPKEQVTKNIQKNLERVLEKLEQHKIKAKIKPETTGKPSQYGSITELLEMHSLISEIKPYIDFSHVHARDNGRFKTKKDIQKVLEEIEKNDSELLNDLNIHFSGIAFSEKGERKHLELQDPENTFPYKLVLECLKEFEVKGTIISESPNIEKDALLMQKYYKTL